MWQYTGIERPDFADEPKAGQESVWDYPRPPVLVSCENLVVVGDQAKPLASTKLALRVLETASPPTYYLPEDCIDWTRLVRAQGGSFCEWKGEATYWSLIDDPSAAPVGWSYAGPSERFFRIDGYVSFYPARIPCYLDADRVEAQPGEFYGGWVTRHIAGPVKGGPATGHW
ncbi:MAG: hypothetical protein ACI9NT_001450 [Bacteroidia bacterium]|jgi:uncharacterized protein (DUF427 family)